MTPSTMNPPLASPDATGDVPCPMCDYNLRGLTDPRCPECGYTFEWPDLLDPTRRKHKYLFEHHPERNVWSFMRTAVGGLLPWRFWRSLRPEQPSNLRRLIVYWLITACGVFTIHVGVYGLVCAFTNTNNTFARPRVIAQLNKPQFAQDIKPFIIQYGSLQAYADALFPLPPSSAFFLQAWRDFRSEPHALVNSEAIVCFLLLPWMTALSLMLFQATMRRARVRGDHVLRCCLYSFDGGWWFGLLTAGSCAATIADALWNSNAPRFVKFLPVVLGLIAAALLVSGIVKLLFAYRMYMRFPHAITTVMLALTITFLVLFTIVVNVPGMLQPLLDVWRSVLR
jgi:hypothetical protein